QPADPLPVLRSKAQFFQHFFSRRRTLLLLKLSSAGAVFFLRRPNADVMDIGRRLQKKLFLWAQAFLPAYQGGKPVDFHKMLDPSGIPPVIVYHLFKESV